MALSNNYDAWAAKQTAPPSGKNYYIVYRDTTLGPMTRDEIFAYDVNENTQVSKDGSPWQPLFTYPELMARLAEKRMTVPASPSELSSKKMLCGIMAILFGYLGIQYFLIGKVGGGLVTILLSLVTCGAWSVLTLIQGILMLCMSDEDFYRKYVASTSFMPLF